MTTLFDANHKAQLYVKKGKSYLRIESVYSWGAKCDVKLEDDTYVTMSPYDRVYTYEELENIWYTQGIEIVDLSNFNSAIENERYIHMWKSLKQRAKRENKAVYNVMKSSYHELSFYDFVQQKNNYDSLIVVQLTFTIELIGVK